MLARDEWHRLLRHLASIRDVYDRMNSVMSLGIDRRARLDFLEKLDEMCNPRSVVDVGCGPGTLSELLLSLRHRYIILADPLPEMLQEALRRIPRAFTDPVVAVGEHLPLRSGAVDAAVAAFSLRDHVDWRKGIAEMVRVSRRCVGILDIRRRRGIMLAAQLAWWGLVVPLAALIVARKSPAHYTQLAKTILKWAPLDEIEGEAARHGRVYAETFAGGFAFRLYILLSAQERSSCGKRGQRGEVRGTRR